MAARSFARARADNRAAIARIGARLAGLSERNIQQQAARAMVSVRRKVQPVAKRIVRQTYAVQPGALSDAFDALTGRDGGQSYVALKARTAPVSLIRFGGRWSKRSPGATAEILRGDRKTYEAAFIATVPSGGRHIFARALRTAGGREPRLPLRRLNGPSAFQMVQGRDGDTARAVSAELSEFAAAETVRLLAAARKEG